MWSRQRNRLISCFECKRKHEVSDQATSTNCPGCSAHIDLRDYKITTSFSRSIRTRGEVYLTSKGDLSSTSVVCRSAMLEGKLRGNLQCEESATVNFVGKIPGRLVANYVCVERKAKFLQFIRKTEQFCGLVLTGKNQIWRRQPGRPVENTTDHVIGNALAEQIGGVFGDSLPVIG